MLESLQQFHFLRPWWFLALLPAVWLVWQLTRSQAQGDHGHALSPLICCPFYWTVKAVKKKIASAGCFCHLLLLYWHWLGPPGKNSPIQWRKTPRP